MDGELVAQLGSLALFVVVVLVLHELAHVVVARTYGYPVVCLGVSPLAIGIVFLDQPLRRYWLLQVTVPMAVTALATYFGLFVLPAPTSAPRVVFGGVVLGQWAFSLGLAALTGTGDLASMALEARRPLWGRERIVRDVRMLKQLGSLVRFTAFGRRYLAEEFGVSPSEFVREIGKRHK